MTEPITARPEIDPTLKALVDAIPMTFKASDGVEAARAKLKQLQAPPEMLPDLRIENRIVGHGDVTDIPVRIYWPSAEPGNLPIVVFYHGGGFALGDLDTHDPVARAHAVGAEAIVVSVDYRLAPEHPFPAGVDDCWAALQWVAEHAAELGGDPTRIAVAGDSAGGNLAAVTALRARDEGGPRLAFQLLWYPSITADLSLPSFTENADAPILDRDVIDAFLQLVRPRRRHQRCESSADRSSRRPTPRTSPGWPRPSSAARNTIRCATTRPSTRGCSTTPVCPPN